MSQTVFTKAKPQKAPSAPALAFLSLLTALLAWFAFAAPAQAQQIDSLYTNLNLDECQPIEPAMMGDTEGRGAYWACVGHNNSLVLVAEGDLRMFVSYGANALEEQSRYETLSPFNTIHTTLEWRAQMVNGDWQPFATILRYFTDSGDGDKRQVLVVTSLTPGNSCHVAHIDASVVNDANTVARQYADQYARNFNCGTDQVMKVPS